MSFIKFDKILVYCILVCSPINVDMGHGIEDMIRDLGQHSFQQAHAPLYSGCTGFTRLSSALALVNLRHDLGGVTRASPNCLSY